MGTLTPEELETEPENLRGLAADDASYDKVLSLTHALLPMCAWGMSEMRFKFCRDACQS